MVDWENGNTAAAVWWRRYSQQRRTQKAAAGAEADGAIQSDSWATFIVIYLSGDQGSRMGFRSNSSPRFVLSVTGARVPWKQEQLVCSEGGRERQIVEGWWCWWQAHVYSRISYDISWASDWSRSRPIRSIRYIVTCARIRAQDRWSDEPWPNTNRTSKPSLATPSVAHSV